MGVFPEDDVIRISELVKLWVAEGFLKPVSGGSTLEEIARVYLKDLADRNLVLIDKMGVCGNIKSCKIHDLLRDLCLREAEKEMFYTLTPQGTVNGQRRIVINNTKSKDDISFLSPMSPVRSLIWNLRGKELPPLSFRLLRVLVSRTNNSTPSTNFVENVHRLVNSRFLNFSGQEFNETPVSIMKFWNLQTLIIRNMIDMQNSWYMPHIRHLVTPDFIDLPDPHEGHDGIVLGNLQTLWVAINFKCSDQVVKRIPNIKKLRAWYVWGSLDDDRDCLTNLDRLDKLESLHFRISRRMNPSDAVSSQRLINFPRSLKKLRMLIGDSDSDYWEQELLDKIGSLPFLQKLKLAFGIFKDGKWETTEGQFRSLKSLVLSHCKNLQVWRTESSHFPCLSHLRLYHIMDLEEFPLDLAEVSTLRLIEVYNCNESFVVSLKRMLEEYEELHGEAELQVRVMLFNLTNKEALKSLEGPNFRIDFGMPRLR